MTKKPDLSQLFGGLHRQLEGDLGIVRDTIGHSGTKGDVSEDKWIEMMRKYLPERYRVNRAFVIDSRNGISQQQDIVVHDRQYSPFVLNLGGALYVPAESVYAVLEVKQTLNAEYIAYAAEKVASVRRLYRTSLPIKYAGGEYPAKPPHHIIGGLVTLDSDWSPPFGDPLHKAITLVPTDGRLDMGCVARYGIFGATYSDNKLTVLSSELSESSLALFLLRFIASLQAIATVPCIDVLAYAANIVRK